MEYKKDSNGWVLRLNPGERLRPALEEFFRTEYRGCGWITGIGGAYNPEVSYFNIEKGAHEPQVLSGFYEVISLGGYVALSDKNEPEVHLQGSFGDKDHRVHGGHVFDLVVGPTLVIFIARLAQTLRLKTDSATGVPLLDLRPR